MGELEHQVGARGLYEHHGVRVEQVFCGVSIDLKDVVIESQPSFGSLTSRGDLSKGKVQ